MKDIENKVQEKVASSLTANGIELLPFIPYLLQDLWELGSSPEDIMHLIKKHISISNNTKMLDLACGKGAVSVNICKELNIETKGIDIIPEFIDYAKEKAIEYGVQNRCKFEVEDINKAVQKEKEYDIVIFGAAEDILGTPFETLQKLKQTVKENGYILIDEAYVETKNQNVKYETYEYLTLDEWKELFKNTNLKLIETLKAEENMQKEMNDYNTNKIVKRAEELIKKYPSKKKLFEEYIENQKAESEDLQENIVGVTWILQRGKDYDK